MENKPQNRYFKSTAYTLKVHKELDGQVRAMFTEIYNHPEQFLIQEVSGWRWGKQDFDASGNVKYPNHPSGTAIDINWSWNGMYSKSGALLVGGTYDPSNSLYSMGADSSIVKIFKKYRWDWGGDWMSLKDYMHFSYLGG